jgi:hypothetical protein
MPRSTCHLYADLLLNSRRGQASLISHTPRPTTVDFSIARDRALGGGHLQRVLSSVNSSLSLPAAWFIICKLIFDLMPQKADGIQFQDPHPTLKLTRRMDGFVDDKTMWQNLLKASMTTRQYGRTCSRPRLFTQGKSLLDSRPLHNEGNN